MTGGLVAIAGYVYDGTVSYYDIAGNTWKGLKAKLNIARFLHSACTLNGIVYVFCGCEYIDYFNSIEMISESSLLANATTLWQLIDVAENILTPRYNTAVAPLNDTEIAILGGSYRFSDVIVFNTTTKTCQKVSAGGDYKFYAAGNQCVQAGINKVVALVKDKDDKPAVISWTKGASAVTIL